MRISTLLFYILLILLPTQAGKHFWPKWSFVHGIRIDYLSPTIFLTDLVLLFLLFFWFLEKPFSRKTLPRKKIFYFFLFLVFLLTSSLLANRPILSFYKVAKLFEFYLFGLYVSKNVATKKHFTLVVFSLVLGTFWSSFLAWAQFLAQSSLSLLFLSTYPLLYFSLQLLGERTFAIATPGVAKASWDSRLVLRPYATFPHPNVLAGFAVVVLALVISNFRLLTEKTRRSSVIYYLSSIIIASATLLITFSRSAWVVWLLVVSCWMLEKKNIVPSLFKKSRAFGLIVLLAALIAYYALPVVFQHFAVLKTDDFLSVSRRIELSKAAFRMVRSSPVFGVGLGNFIPKLSDFSRSREAIYWLQPVHNIFFLVAAETGLVGLGIFLWFLVFTFKRLLKPLLTINYSLLTTLASVLALGLFDHYFFTLQQTQFLFSLVLGLCWLERK